MDDLFARLQADLKVAMRARDAERTSVLRMLLARIQEKQVAGDERTTLSDEQIEKVLVSFAKQRREAADAFAQAGREDLQAKEMREHDIVRSYLPELLDEASIRAVLQEVVTSTGAHSPKDLGKVMGVAMQRLRGRADGARVRALVRELLGD